MAQTPLITLKGTSAVVASGTSENSITLNPKKEYTLKHLGVAAAGTGDTDTIFFSATASGDADFAVNADKCPLQSGDAVVVGPGVSTLYFITATSSPVFRVTPSAMYENSRAYDN